MHVYRWMRRRFPTWESLWSEVWNLFKFGVVGVTSLLLYNLIFALLSRVISPDGNRTIQAVASALGSSVYNFLLHKNWTFGAKHFNAHMLFRYLVVMGIGVSLSGILFYLGHEVLGLYDFLVLNGSSFLIAGATYFLHRLYTFHPRHARVTES